MAEDKGSEKPKSLEMRVAELEDKISQMHVTEEELKAYQKVTSLMGGQMAAAPGTSTVPSICTISPQCVINPVCIVRRCIINPICIIRCIINPICQCFECGGGCAPGGVGGGAGGFGSFGM